jgi:hypothetical protein
MREKASIRQVAAARCPRLAAARAEWAARTDTITNAGTV